MRFFPIFILPLAMPAMAAPPPGADLRSPEHAWWECHLQPATKVSCCHEADGHVLGDDEWRIREGAGGTVYQVHVGAKWFDVPQEAVVNDTNHCGAEPDPVKRPMAKVWYYPIWGLGGVMNIKIRCFIVGTMY
jgi:hypothetical protein